MSHTGTYFFYPVFDRYDLGYFTEFIAAQFWCDSPNDVFLFFGICRSYRAFQFRPYPYVIPKACASPSPMPIIFNVPVLKAMMPVTGNRIAEPIVFGCQPLCNEQ